MKYIFFREDWDKVRVEWDYFVLLFIYWFYWSTNILGGCVPFNLNIFCLVFINPDLVWVLVFSNCELYVCKVLSSFHMSFFSFQTLCHRHQLSPLSFIIFYLFFMRIVFGCFFVPMCLGTATNTSHISCHGIIFIPLSLLK